MIVQLNSLPDVKKCGYDSVLCFGDSDWWYHNRGHADMQFMRRFARHTRVVYVNSLGVRTPSVAEGRMFARKVARKLRSMSRFYRDGGEGFDVMTPLYAPFAGGFAASAAQAALTTQVKTVLRVRGMRRPLLWVVCPTASRIIARLKQQFIVYQLSDCYGALSGSDSAGGDAHERLIAGRADMIVCSSQRLLERARRLYGKGEYIDHGVDFELFGNASQQPVPAELSSLKSPIIGFFGNMDSNTVDRNLLDAVCRLRPQYSFVLVGDMSHEFETLKTLPNVKAIPRQPYQRIAAFGAAFHVCLMPWLQNPWIEHCNPVKLKEYLALGKPVVTTPFPELQRHPDMCLIATSPQDFAVAIDRALEHDSAIEQARRREWASHHTWDDKFETVLACLRQRGIQAGE